MVHPPPLEDELGDVLEKAMKVSGLREDQLAARTGIDVNRIKDALLYRYDFSSRELGVLAAALGLNEVGLRALAEERFPQPETGGLPFRLHVLSMPYGVGVVNAYIVARCDAPAAILFDSGCCARELAQAWPAEVQRLCGHFVTHWDSDHSGGCRETMARFGLSCCLGPGPAREGVRVLAEAEKLEIGGLTITVCSTPGHTREHYCYLVGRTDRPETRQVLFSGDLFFCGSIGGGYFDTGAVLKHARDLWRRLPGETIVAPGHGPLTTIATEREFNPFAPPA
jgi:hydroxyacylglutathione hydrolase